MRALLALLCMHVLGCARAPEDTVAIVVEHSFEPLPAHVGPLHVALRLRDGERVLPGAELSLEGNMSHAGMVPVQATLRPAAPGAYEGTLELSMAGDWFVRVWGKLADGRPIDRTIALRGVLPAQ